MSIQRDVRAVQQRIARAAERSGRPPAAVTLVAAAKYAGSDAIREAIDAGIVHFGENRVQDAQRKIEALGVLRGRTTWHMIGTLQSNKAKTSILVFDIIQSVASVRLGQRLDRLLDAPMPVYLEVNVAEEAGKHGFRPHELQEAWAQLRHCGHLDVRGLMTIAPLASDPEDVRPVFRRLRELALGLGLPELSMGMTNDFEMAIEEGATMVRVGRAIFGQETPRGNG